MKKTIIIFGFSGSGKTIMANRLAKGLKLRVVHPSGILRAICLGKDWKKYKKVGNNGFWESEKGAKILKDRLNEDVPPDVLCDKIIMREAKRGGVVIDSWSLPWLFKEGIKIYLKASRKLRAERVSKRDRQDFKKIYNIIYQKDHDTRMLYKRIGKFDIAKDFDVFDVIIDTSSLTKESVEKKIMDYVKNKQNPL